MVIPLGPGKFYGSSLPRPRYYTDVKFNQDRVDPPAPVLDPFLSWANEAHWSMGGLSFKRLRYQGRIEGSVKGLRDQREKLDRIHSPVSKTKTVKVDPDVEQRKEIKDKERVRSDSVSPPPAPVAIKRRRLLVEMSDEEEDDNNESENEEEEGVEEERERGRVARKLVGEFDKVASKGVGDDVMKVVEDLNLNELVGEKKRKKKVKVSENGGNVVKSSRSRSSPRLAKKKLS